MTHLSKAFLVLAFMASVMLIARASDMGTPTERAACADDAKKFCANAVVGTPFTVAACFRAHLAQLSPKCRAVIAKRGVK